MLDDLKKMGELANTTLGQTLSNTYAGQLKSIQAFSLTAKKKNKLPNWMINDLLDRPINEFLKNTPVVRVKIFTTSGKTIYSTNKTQYNKVDTLERHAIDAAKKGIIFSEMENRPNFNLNNGTKSDLTIISTYMPISKDGKVIGVLELYNDISSAYQKVQDGLQLFISVLFILGLSFFYTVIYFVQKAERIIESKRESEKRDHEYLKIAFKKATESTRVKSEFLASMSHELRTPLNAIIGYSEILIEENIEANNLESQAELNNIKSAGIHLKTLIEEILDHAKIESGIIDIQTVNCSLQNIIESCVSYVMPDADNNGNIISTAIDDNLSEINTDETKIKRIILNLISNANKFTHDGKIAVSATIENKNILVRVKDSGVGIPEKQFHKIFEPFTQVDSSYTRTHGGTGLGLTISQEYAKALGGVITVSSQVGKGTTMVLTFPYCKAQQTIKDSTNFRISPTG